MCLCLCYVWVGVCVVAVCKKGLGHKEGKMNIGEYLTDHRALM